jgi:PAS domain S-box-containing protein
MQIRPDPPRGQRNPAPKEHPMAKKINTDRITIIWLGIFVVSTVAIFIGGYKYYSLETERIRAEKYQELAAIGKLKAGQIEQWRQDRLENISRIAKAPFLQQAVHEWLRDKDNPQLRTNLQKWSAMAQREQHYAGVLLLDTESRVLLSAEVQPVPLSPEEKVIIEQALENRVPMLSDLYRNEQGLIQIDAVGPVLSSDGQPIAVWVLRSNAESVLYPLIQSWPTPSKTAETLLVRKDGDNVLFLNNLRHRPSTALSLREPLSLQDLPAVQGVLRREGMFEGKDYRGVQVLADLRHIPNSPWFMVAKVDTSEILDEAKYRGGVVILFSALFILLAASATAFGYRYRQAGMYKRLYRAEREQRLAQEEFRTTFYSIGDALITTNTAGIVNQMNPVAELLTGWKETEATGKPLEEVFHVINEDSRVTVENPVSRVIREGIVVGLANHTLLIAKDGSEHPIADSGAPIADENGTVIGVVLVFRDQTAERKSRRRLEETAEALRKEKDFTDTVLNSQRDTFFLFEPATGKAIRWNQAFNDVSGYTDEEITEIPAPDSYYSSEDLERARRFSQEILDAGIGRIELELVRKDGSKVPTEYDVSVVKDADGKAKYLVSVGRDITERKKSQEKLQKSEALLNSIIEQSPFSMWISDKEGTLIRINPACKKWVRVTDKDVVGVYNVLKDEAIVAQGLMPLVRSVFENGEQASFELGWDSTLIKHLGHKEAFKLILSVTIFPVKDAEGKVTNAVCQHIDITERKRAEKNLRQSEERYRRLHETMRDAFVQVDMSGMIVDSNSAYQNMLGYEPDELLKLNYTDLTPQQWHDFEAGIVSEQILPYGQSEVYEKEYIRKDGSLLPVDLRASLLADENGKPIAIWAIVRDITDRKQNENERRRSLERQERINHLQQALLGSADLVTKLKMIADGVVDIWGADFCRVWHIAPGDLCEEGCIHGTATERPHVCVDRRRCLRLLASSGRYTHTDGLGHRRVPFGAYKIGRVASGEEHKFLTNDVTNEPGIHDREWARELGLVAFAGYQLRPPGGETIGVLALFSKHPISPEEDAQLDGFSNAVARVIHSAQHEERLKESEAKFRDFFVMANDGVFIASPEGQWVDFNDVTLKMLGYENREELLQRRMTQFFENPEDAERFSRLVMEKEEAKDFPIRMKRKDGAIIETLVSARAKKLRDGTIESLSGAIRDVTERKRLQDQLSQAQKMEAVGTLAGGVAHDFNNVLQVALGYSELLLGDEKLPEHCRSDLRKVYDSAKRGADLVQRLMTFSRKTEIKPQPLNLNRRITELRKMLERTIPKMVEIDLILGEDIATISADPTQMDQILMNLAVNARDAMPDGGRLTIETSNVVLDEEYAGMHLDVQPAPHVLLTVADTGFGMDKDTLQHIFEPFYTTKGVGEGTGLGLAMVHGIVKQHGGHIGCYSEPGHGTTFRMYFPALISEEEQEAVTERPMPQGGSETILLVDDEEMIRDLGSRILSKAGYKVITAANGKEALEIYAQQGSAIDLVLLDLMMPEMGGKQCLEGLLSLNPSLKVVIASGFSANGPTKDALSAGARAFVNKPYDMRQVRGVVREVLDAG